MKEQKYRGGGIIESRVSLFRNYVNCGKGRALKNAMNHLLTSPHYADIIGFVCIDSDGQHCLGDIKKCVEVFLQSQDSMILGSRTFSEKPIPLRSRIGNVITSKVLSVMCGIHIRDTQTGLRVFSIETAREFLTTSGERYEYEMNVLVETKEKQIPLIEVPIQTIYLDDNKSSHFNPVIDSLKIYRVFLKFLFSSLSSFIIDITFFAILIMAIKPYSGNYILISTVVARAVSSVFNYAINKRLVFKKAVGRIHSFTKYYILCIVQMLISAWAIRLIYSYNGVSETLIKILIDTLLFIISFHIQRDWVYASGKGGRANG